MTLILSAITLGAVAITAQEISLDAGLWVGIALCAASIWRRPGSGSPLVTSLAFGMAMLLTSLTLVAA